MMSARSKLLIFYLQYWEKFEKEFSNHFLDWIIQKANDPDEHARYIEILDELRKPDQQIEKIIEEKKQFKLL